MFSSNFPAIKCKENDTHAIDLGGNHTDWMMDRKKKFPDVYDFNSKNIFHLQKLFFKIVYFKLFIGTERYR